MSAHPRVVHKRRQTITDLPLYYSGPLLKKHKKEKDFTKYYGELRGATLFLYKDDTQDTYTEKLDLEALKSMDLESPYQKKAPTIFTLKLRTDEVQLKMDNPDTGEEWRGYILTVIKKEIPSKLLLLPGQLLKLEETLTQEKRRNPPMPRPALPPRPAFLTSPSAAPPKDEPDSTPEVPACFFKVTRKEAEQMLEANPEYGSMILRPSTLANNYAVTLRQVMPSGPVMKNYRVTSTDSGFVIELDTAVTVASLNDVLQYFLKKTQYRLQPYMPSQPYDTRIDLTPAPKCISITSPTPKKLPSAQVAPMLRSKTDGELLHQKSKPAENEYVIPDDHTLDDHKEKLAQLDGELREMLKIRRDNMYAAADEEEGTTYENETCKKSHSSTAQWTSEA